MKTSEGSYHPSDDIRGSDGDELTGTRIALCVTGSVAAVRSVDIARSLMRRGAEVFPVMSDAAKGLIGADLLHWATGTEPVTELTGEIEHVALAGNYERRCDLVLVAPATANTIGKIASGIDDTPVTTTVTTAIGQGLPVVVVPAMHEPMYDHPIVRENIETLQRHGLSLVMPDVSEGKAKIAATGLIIRSVIEILVADPTHRSLEGRRILVTAGRTVEYIDDIRCITNNSTGKMGIAIVTAALLRGAAVTIVYGKGTAVPPTGATVHHVDTAEEMQARVYEEIKSSEYDVVIATAAVGDWRPAQRVRGKVATHGVSSINIELVPTPKIIDGIKAVDPSTFLVAFRALSNIDHEELIENAFQRMVRANADMIAVNDTSKSGVGFESDTNELFVIDRDRAVDHIPVASKSEVGSLLLDKIESRLEGGAP